MIPKKVYLIIEEYFIASCENAKPGKISYFGMSM